MSKFRVGVTPDFYTDAKGRFEHILSQKLRGDVDWSPMPPQPGKIATPDALNQFDAIFSLALKITRESLQGVERLALVARWGVGYDMIDTVALSEHDVLLAITPQAVRRPVAESIVTLVFALSTNLLTQDRTVRAGQWRGALPSLGRNIRGRVLGSIGCGNIAQEMFRMCGSLGFSRLIAHDPYLRETAAASMGVELVSFDDVFRQADFVAVNVPLSAATRKLIGERELRMMKPSAYLINTARGPIVDQDAMVQALREKWIAGAGLDVFENEPLEEGNPLPELDNVILSPHSLAWTEETIRDNTTEACENILAFSRGELPHAMVNRDVINRPGFQAKLAARRR